MKLLCDVCEKTVASVVCCADEAALCLPCDARVHAANKLASKHQRVPLLSETSEPALCDICQERSSFFFCVEDRALLCRECDVSIHSANALAAKHRRFLLTGVRVGMNSTSSCSQETSSVVTEHMASPSNNNSSVKKLKQATVATPYNGSKPSPAAASKGKPSSSISKMATPSTIFMHSNINKAMVTSKETPHRPLQPNPLLKSTPGLSIQRLSSGRIPFIAPVLSTLSTLNPTTTPVTEMDHGSSSNANISDYFTGIPGWKLDELLTDLAGVCESGQTAPPKEDNILPGFGEQEPPWYAELDFLEEQLSPSQDAEVPEVPSPPTASGLFTSRGKPSCPAAHTWNFDYLFTGPDELNDVSVVPDIDERRSSPTTTITIGNNKKRKNWLGV